MNVLAIYRNQPDSYNGRSYVVALAADKDAALRWVAQEMSDHDNPPEYWVEKYPLFTFKEMEVHL